MSMVGRTQIGEFVGFILNRLVVESESTERVFLSIIPSNRKLLALQFLISLHWLFTRSNESGETLCQKKWFELLCWLVEGEN